MSNVKKEDAGRLLADTLRSFLYDLEVEDGLSAIGYTKEDIPSLVKGTIPQVNISRHVAVLKTLHGAEFQLSAKNDLSKITQAA